MGLGFPLPCFAQRGGQLLPMLPVLPFSANSPPLVPLPVMWTRHKARGTGAPVPARPCCMLSCMFALGVWLKVFGPLGLAAEGLFL
jgi:hypothetical protein